MGGSVVLRAAVLQREFLLARQQIQFEVVTTVFLSQISKDVHISV